MRSGTAVAPPDSLKGRQRHRYGRGLQCRACATALSRLRVAPYDDLCRLTQPALHSQQKEYRQ
jgi:hypothetical protein